MSRYPKPLALHALSPLLGLLVGACGPQPEIDPSLLEFSTVDWLQEGAPPTTPYAAASAGSEPEPMEEDAGASGGSSTPLDRAMLPHDMPPHEEPAAGSQGAVHPVWEVNHGEDLYTTLVRWCARTGRWEVKRDTRYRWPIDADAVFQAPFLEAVSRLQEALGNRIPRPALTAYHGNHQIVIRDSSTEQY